MMNVIELLYGIKLHVRVEPTGYILVETVRHQQDLMKFATIEEIKLYLRDLMIVEGVIHETN